MSEFSAQRRSHPPNPKVSQAIGFLSEIIGGHILGVVADVGCGKLRHYRILLNAAKILLLVDTERQMAAIHHDGKSSYTIPEVARSARKRGRSVYALTIQQFRGGRQLVDVALCAAVFDVIVRDKRQEIIRSVSERLKPSGYFVVIIPRNDSTITRRFFEENKYKDGHVFSHHGLQTFFCNFERYTTVIADCEDVGLELLRDLSSYRQVCLIFRKE